MCEKIVGEQVRGLEKEGVRQGTYKASEVIIRMLALTWGEIRSYLDGVE